VTPDEIQLTPTEHADYLKAAYAAAFSAEAIAARASKNETTNSVISSSSTTTNRASKALASVPGGSELNPAGKGATELMKKSASVESKLPAQDLEAQLLETIEVTTGDFQTLAIERAQRVKEYILKTGKVEPERLFLTDSTGQAATFKGSRVYLHLR
jgi:hypothetical protein